MPAYRHWQLTMPIIEQISALEMVVSHSKIRTIGGMANSPKNPAEKYTQNSAYYAVPFSTESWNFRKLLESARHGIV
jgi:hypothetical protein